MLGARQPLLRPGHAAGTLGPTSLLPWQPRLPPASAPECSFSAARRLPAALLRGRHGPARSAGAGCSQWDPNTTLLCCAHRDPCGSRHRPRRCTLIALRHRTPAAGPCHSPSAAPARGGGPRRPGEFAHWRPAWPPGPPARCCRQPWALDYHLRGQAGQGCQATVLAPRGCRAQSAALITARGRAITGQPLNAGHVRASCRRASGRRVVAGSGHPHPR